RLGVDRERQRLGLGENLERRDLHLDLAGRQLGIDRLGRAPNHLAADRDHAFELQRVDLLEERRGDVDDALRDAVMIAQIDEEKLAVIALPVDPAGKAGFGSGGRKAQRAACRGSVRVHGAQKAWSGTALSSGGGDAAGRRKLALLQGRPLNLLAKLALFGDYPGLDRSVLACHDLPTIKGANA